MSHIVFVTIGWVMKLAPIAGFAAMSYLTGQYG